MRYRALIRPPSVNPAVSTWAVDGPEYIKRLESTSIDPLQGANFQGRLEYGDLGQLRFCRMTASALRYSRHLSKLLDNALKNKQDKKQLEHDFRVFKRTASRPVSSATWPTAT